MPPLDGLLETALYVDDPAHSASFYREVFGFEEMVASDRLHALVIPERIVLLLFRKGASASLPVPHDGSGQSHLAFAIPSAALEDWKRWLDRHDIPIVETRVWERGGTSLYFRDPDGHLLEVATPGVWPRAY
jgi:catechol 2,3-dioxygenase-like lactoylglutathione lyase family enzyme